MASVQAVYNSLKDLTNKEQKGFITPQIFNSLASLAQMNIYNEFFTELIDVKKLSRQGFELGRDKSIRKFKLEDLSFMVRSATVDSSNNVFDRPDDLSRIISIRINNTPTESFPVALIGREIEVFPSTINSIIITYYKKPTSFEVGTRNESPLQPAYNAFEQWDGSLQFNPVGSLDFMLPDHCIPEIVNEMAKLLGVRLRDQNVQVTATREEASE